MSPTRVLIFNLPRQADAAGVRALVSAGLGAPPWPIPGRQPGPAVDLHDIPGADDEQFAVVHLGTGRRQARELVRHLNACRHLDGQALPRPLWSWLPVMAWG